MLISKWLNSVFQEILSTEVPNMYKVCFLPHQQIFCNSHCCTMLLGHQRPPPMGKIELYTVWMMWLPWWLNSKEYSCQCRRHRRLRFNPWVGWSPGEGNGNLLQYSCLENSMDRGAWWATVHGVAKSQTWVSKRLTHTHTGKAKQGGCTA